MYFRRFARKARPILGERDYSAAKQLLRRSVRLSLLPGEEERMEALLREIVAYEWDLRGPDHDRAVAFAEYVLVPEAPGDGRGRRWTDRVEQVPVAAPNHP
jgi:hypothetical protein